jgi:hypothetical protein
MVSDKLCKNILIIVKFLLKILKEDEEVVVLNKSVKVNFILQIL